VQPRRYTIKRAWRGFLRVAKPAERAFSVLHSICA
jgi:hypothetical protein